LLEDLGDAGSVIHNTDPKEPEYRYAWQTGKLLQVFDLVWTAGPESENAARAFAARMAARVPPPPSD
jgi:hypothetical protein